MKGILWSIRRPHTDNIKSGKKTIEVRKVIPKDLTPKTPNFIYETKANGGCGKVIGEFTCDKVYKFICTYDGTLVAADENDHFVDNKDYFPFTIQNQTCLTRKELRDYLQEKLGYGLHITDLKIYDKPKELIEFCKPFNPNMDIHEFFKHIGGGFPAHDFKSKYDFCDKITRPPQSWCYVEVDLE